MNDTSPASNAGQRGAQPQESPMAWLGDPNDPRNQAALAWTCDICNARIMHLCENTIHPGKPLPARVNHHARLVDRRREK